MIKKLQKLCKCSIIALSDFFSLIYFNSEGKPPKILGGLKMENLLATHQKTLTTYCKQCHKNYEVTENRIFSGGEFSKYATRCPVCGFGRGLPFKEVEKVFGELKV